MNAKECEREHWRESELNEVFKEKMISGGYCPKCGDFLIPRKMSKKINSFGNPVTHDYGIKMKCINPECDFKKEIDKNMNFIDDDEVELVLKHEQSLNDPKKERFFKYLELGMIPDKSFIDRWAETWDIPHSFINKYPTRTGQLLASNPNHLMEYSWDAGRGKYRLDTQDRTGIHCIGFLTAKDLEFVLDNEIEIGGKFIGGTSI